MSIAKLRALNLPNIIAIRKGRGPLHQWTEDDRDILRREYDGNWHTIDRIAMRLGVSYNAVTSQASRLGLRRTRQPAWTPGETRHLISCHEKGLTIRQTAQSFFDAGYYRSTDAIAVKKRRLHLIHKVRDGWFTRTEVCQMLGVWRNKVQGWIDSGKLKASRISDSEFWRIEEKDLREFVIRFREELSGRNADIPSLVELLAPGQIIT